MKFPGTIVSSASTRARRNRATVSFRGGSTQLKRELGAAAHWMLLRELGPRLYRTIYLRIQLIRGLSVNGIHGDCAWDDDNYRPREFTIRIDPNISALDLYLTLAHEITHLRQFAKGQLFHFARGDNIRFFGVVTKDISTVDEYPLSAWEVEAYDNQHTLVDAYMCAHSILFLKKPTPVKDSM